MCQQVAPIEIYVKTTTVTKQQQQKTNLYAVNKQPTEDTKDSVNKQACHALCRSQP